MIGKLSHPASLWEAKVWRNDAGQRFLRTSRTTYQRSNTVNMIIPWPLWVICDFWMWWPGTSQGCSSVTQNTVLVKPQPESTGANRDVTTTPWESMSVINRKRQLSHSWPHLYMLLLVVPKLTHQQILTGSHEDQQETPLPKRNSSVRVSGLLS